LEFNSSWNIGKLQIVGCWLLRNCSLEEMQLDEQMLIGSTCLLNISRLL